MSLSRFLICLLILATPSVWADDSVKPLDFRIVGTCERSVFGQDSSMTSQQPLEFRRDGPQTALLSSFLFPDKSNFVFALTPVGTLLKGGTKEVIAHTYAFTVTRLVRPQDLIESMSIGKTAKESSIEFYPDPLDGNVEGQTSIWVDLSVYLDGRIEASYRDGNQFVHQEDRQIEFVLKYAMTKPPGPSGTFFTLGGLFTPVEKIFSPMKRILSMGKDGRLDIKHRTEFELKVKLQFPDDSTVQGTVGVME